MSAANNLWGILALGDRTRPFRFGAVCRLKKALASPFLESVVSPCSVSESCLCVMNHGVKCVEAVSVYVQRRLRQRTGVTSSYRQGRVQMTGDLETTFCRDRLKLFLKYDWYLSWVFEYLGSKYGRVR